ncbi:hypothetical protein MVEN_00453700 [Mycena venus]|uniref:Uncharacterized protein n=1 Tax=Mycena venus TaxID=2733690 RepID=A0A8H6YVQ5_9AGAR|nr:hypothetical protein MVEN_00453700 [Mycena venus]
MRTTILTTAITLAVTATSATARNCKYGYNYCGRTLRSIGNYDDFIEVAMNNVGQTGYADDVLFTCSTILGNIQYVQSCGTCVDGNQGNNDYCA